MNFSLYTTKAANSLLHLSSFIEFRKPNEYYENIFKVSMLKIKRTIDMSHLKFRCFYEKSSFKGTVECQRRLSKKKISFLRKKISVLNPSLLIQCIITDIMHFFLSRNLILIYKFFFTSHNLPHGT